MKKQLTLLVMGIAIVLASFSYTSSNATSWTGYQIGDFSYLDDDAGNSYTSYSIGDFDYVSGSNGYSGTGYQIGSFYYYNDNADDCWDY